MKLILLLLCVSSSTYAGFIVPDTKNHSLTINNNGMATAWSTRRNFNAGYKYEKYKEDITDDKDTTGLVYASGYFHQDQLSGEAFVGTQNSKSESGSGSSSLEYTTTLLVGNVGYKLSDNLVIGGSLTYTKVEDLKVSMPGVSVGYKLTDHFILGAGFMNFHIGDYEVNQKNYYIGLGYLTESIASELVFFSTKGEENVVTNHYMMDDTVIRLGTTYHTENRLELVCDLRYVKSEANYVFSSADEEDTLLDIEASAEFPLTDSLAVGPLLSYTKSEEKEKTYGPQIDKSTTLAYGVAGRMKMDNLQVHGSMSLGKKTSERDGVDNNDVDLFSAALDVSFFF